MTDSKSHYSMLTEYHDQGARAAATIERCLGVIEQASKDLLEARQVLAGVQKLISSYYTEINESNSAAHREDADGDTGARNIQQ